MPMPPRLPGDMDVSPFADGLQETISEKIAETIAYMEYLEQELADWQRIVRMLKRREEIDQFGVYFWLLWAELAYSDYYVCQKWLIYWLDLYEKLPETKPRPIDRDQQNRLDREFAIQRAKRVPIENLYQGKLHGNGPRLTGRCPFHEEKTPSFFIFTNTNTFHCFGACGQGGDVIDFVMRLKNISFNDAIKFLI